MTGEETDPTLRPVHGGPRHTPPPTPPRRSWMPNRKVGSASFTAAGVSFGFSALELQRIDIPLPSASALSSVLILLVAYLVPEQDQPPGRHGKD